MSQSMPKTRDLAERLVAHEMRGKASSQKSPTIFQVCEKFRPPLSMLMGNAGFRALLSRALALASEEVEWLRTVRVKADGSLEGINELVPPADARRLSEGRVALLTHLLSLLVAFIGEDLTLRLVSDVWPKLSVKDLDLGGGKK
jgi:hypothetical protein